jgi:hypothetical protein
MRTVLASLAFALTLTSTALGAPQQVTHVLTLRGYYVLNFFPYWELSDKKPWYVLEKAPWADPVLIKYGYRAVDHDGKHFYCFIQEEPPVGTRIGRSDICGSPRMAEMLYTMNWRPVISSFGSPH